MTSTTTRHTLRSTVICGLILLFAASLAQAQYTFTEDFTTTVNQDGATTADWDTAAGELRLYPFAPQLEGTWNSPGDAQDVAVDGHYAYVADYTSGIQVIDISDPTTPTIIGTYNTPHQARAIKIAGDHAFVADTNSGLLVLDISDPTNPTLVGSLDTGTVYGLAVSGNYAYLAGSSDGLQIVDISNPANPALVASYNTAGTSLDVRIVGVFAYVADFDNGLQVINVMNAGNPLLAGSYSMSNFAMGLDVVGNRAYIAADVGGMVILDISDESTPVPLATFDTPDRAKSVTVTGNYAYVSDADSGLQVVNITDPSQPVLDSSYNTTGRAYKTIIAERHAYVADGSGGLQVIAVADELWPAQVGSGATSGLAMGIDVVGDLAYLAVSGIGLRTMDCSDPSWPQLLDVSSSAWDGEDVKVDGTIAFLAAGDDGLLTFDVSDPTAIWITGGVNTPDHAYGVALSGDQAYVADGATGLMAMNITIPGSPGAIDVLNTAGSARGVCIAGDYAYVADWGNGLLVIDISDPTSMVQVGHYDSPGFAHGLAVEGNYAYLALGNSGVVAIDISNPAAPFPTDTWSTSGYVRRIQISGTRAYIPNGAAGFRILDISDPYNLSSDGSGGNIGYAYALDISGELTYVVSQNYGVAVFQTMQRESDATRNIGQSNEITFATDDIVRYRLNSTQTSYVAWSMRANNFSNWYTTPQDGTWMTAWEPTNVLQWRAKLYANPATPMVVSNLTIDWLLTAAKIESIADVAADQGRQVRLEWSRSGHDFAGDSNQITEYAVYRAIEGGVQKASPPMDDAHLSLSAKQHAQNMKAQGWDFLATVPVRQEDRYFFVAPTLADSTVSGGQHLTTFMITALTATPEVFYDSPVGSGYSVDNLAPGVPTGLSATYEAVNVVLDWNDSPANDFQYFRIYRGASPEFVPGPANLVQETAVSSWIDLGGSAMNSHYKVSALDFAGNESPVATAESPSGVPGVGGAHFALHNAVPNPFNPRTSISYSTPGTQRVALAIYDLAGRQVRVLVDEVQSAGTYTTTWDGMDQSGMRVASGVYFYRLRSGTMVEQKRVMLIK